MVVPVRSIACRPASKSGERWGTLSCAQQPSAPLNPRAACAPSTPLRQLGRYRAAVERLMRPQSGGYFVMPQSLWLFLENDDAGRRVFYRNHNCRGHATSRTRTSRHRL